METTVEQLLAEAREMALELRFAHKLIAALQAETARLRDVHAEVQHTSQEEAGI